MLLSKIQLLWTEAEVGERPESDEQKTTPRETPFLQIFADGEVNALGPNLLLRCNFFPSSHFP